MFSEFYEGEKLETVSGRITDYVPVDGSNYMTGWKLDVMTEWLINEAILEATSKSDFAELSSFSRLTPDNISDENADDLFDYLFCTS